MHVLQSRNHVMVCNASNSATLIGIAPTETWYQYAGR